jgi:hypothetical protein
MHGTTQVKFTTAHKVSGSGKFTTGCNAFETTNDDGQ